MTDEQAKRAPIVTRPGVQFVLAGIWLLFGVVGLITADGPGRWFTPVCGATLFVLYGVTGVLALRKARPQRADR